MESSPHEAHFGSRKIVQKGLFLWDSNYFFRERRINMQENDTVVRNPGSSCIKTRGITSFSMKTSRNMILDTHCGMHTNN
mmetsp:Transcript_6048/g.22877  ORF Transcript_6048/g.22877 Transcript_6048/m.22877 type:complete len:80 (-) Transcript_6048:151-390(-)